MFGGDAERYEVLSIRIRVSAKVGHSPDGGLSCLVQGLFIVMSRGYLVVQVYGGLVDSPGYDNTLRKENIRLESRTSRVGATDSSTGPLEDGCVATLQECYFDLQFHQQKY